MDSAQTLNTALEQTGAKPDAALFARLDDAYAGPGRHYHCKTHIAECLSLLDEHRRQAERPYEMIVAIWFHDAVYDTTRFDNEARSAEWARKFLSRAGADAAAIDRSPR